MGPEQINEQQLQVMKEEKPNTTERELGKNLLLNNPQKKRELPERFRPNRGKRGVDTFYQIKTDREKMEKTIPENLAVVYRPCICYVGCIVPVRGRRYVMFQDGEGYTHIGYPNKVDNLKAVDIYKEIKDKEGNYKVGDTIFARFGEAVAIAEIKEIKDNGYILNFGQTITIEEGEEGEIKDAIDFRSKEETEETIRKELEKLNNKKDDEIQ